MHNPLRSNHSTLSRVADFPANTNNAPASIGSCPTRSRANCANRSNPYRMSTGSVQTKMRTPAGITTPPPGRAATAPVPPRRTTSALQRTGHSPTATRICRRESAVPPAPRRSSRAQLGPPPAGDLPAVRHRYSVCAETPIRPANPAALSPLSSHSASSLRHSLGRLRLCFMPPQLRHPRVLASYASRRTDTEDSRRSLRMGGPDAAHSRRQKSIAITTLLKWRGLEAAQKLFARGHDLSHPVRGIVMKPVDDLSRRELETQ